MTLWLAIGIGVNLHCREIFDWNGKSGIFRRHRVVIGYIENFVEEVLDDPQNFPVWRAAIFVISLLWFSCALVGGIGELNVFAVQIQIYVCFGADSLWCGWWVGLVLG
jgi:hypothetical protein